jgi:phosphopantetheinyl transferase (holo-ACP synthase)
MIGNDVVDLATAKKENNWRRKGYLEKLFTEDEIALIKTADNQDVMVWNLWSRKEAAYKIFNRDTGLRAFIPLQLVCTYVNELQGTVYCQGKTYYTKTVINADHIHTIAVVDTKILKNIVFLKDRKLILKNEGIPYLIQPEITQTVPVSISHHGNYEYIIAMS